MSRHEHAAALSLAPGSVAVPARETCGHDHAPFNTDPAQNAALRRPVPPVSPPWYDALGLLPTSNLTKRDDVAGGGTGAECVWIYIGVGRAVLNTPFL